MSEETTAAVVPETRRTYGPNLDYVYKLSIVVLAALAVILVALYVGRAAVYKIHEFERGLHLRGGRFLGVQMPGWHAQIPLVDTVIIVKVNERLGYVERIPAMTSDNVTMDVSLQFTYRVTNPERFALAVDDPEARIAELLSHRTPAYSQAHHTIETDGVTADGVAERIAAVSGIDMTFRE